MLEIGDRRIFGRVFLAPMAGVTDPDFREICIEEGAAHAPSEMISSDTTLHATDKTRHRVARVRAGALHAVQIVGTEPAALASAARFNHACGAEVIDINMGCPAKKVCQKLAGSALLEHPALVRQILDAVVEAVPIPVTLKIRTGPSPDRRNGVEIARIAEASGVAMLAVHGRTRADRFKGAAEYDTIRDIKRAVSIPVIANGDVGDVEDAIRVLDHTGADGVMIGRAAQGDPWVFRRVVAGLDRRSVDEPGSAERHGTIQRHLDGLYRRYGEFRGVRIARKHIAWYCKGGAHAAAFRQRFNQAESATHQRRLIEYWFEAPASLRLTA